MTLSWFQPPLADGRGMAEPAGAGRVHFRWLRLHLEHHGGARVGATGASMVTYLTPLVGGSMGVMLRGDSLTWNAPLGGLIVIAGIALSQSTPKRVHSPG